MNELITFKGSNDGLILVITKKANFNQIKEALSKKLASCSNFFEANTTILLKDDKFSQEEQNILADILKQYQLNLKIVAVDKTATNQHCSIPAGQSIKMKSKSALISEHKATTCSGDTASLSFV
jgi:septum site-determining protein MinC